MPKNIEIQAAINHWVDEHSEEVIGLTESLIRFKSENRVPLGLEGDAQRFVAEQMQGMRLDVDIFLPTDVPELLTHPLMWQGREYKDRPNVVGTLRGKNPRGGRSLLFSSHIDVVAGTPGGRFAPFEPAREAGKLYGRGSNDMKGGLAATMMALKCLREIGVRLNGDVIVESVVDEENGGSNGTIASRLRGHNADACIVPEPTSMVVAPAHKGGRVWELSLVGSPGMPFGASELINPAYGIAHLVVAIEEWEQVRNRVTPVHPMFAEIPGLPVILSAVQSGDFEPGSGDGVPSTARMEVWAEEYPGTTAEEHEERFIGYIKSVAARTPVIQKCEMEIRPVTRFLPGSEIPADAPIVKTVAEAFGNISREKAVVRGAPFACDVYVFNQFAKIPCVILGPHGGNAHTADEWVSIDDLIALTKIFALSAVEWCGQSEG